MRSDGFDPRVLRFCAWTGFGFAFAWPFAAFVLTHGQYIPAPSAADSANKVVSEYLAHLTGIRIATVVFIFSSVLYTTWSMAIIQMVRLRERRWPILFNIMVVAVACEVVVVMFIGFFFACAAWRPGETSPDVTQALNDLGWLGVLFTGAPFALFQLALAATTFLAGERSTYPRWTGYFNVFTSVFMFEACLLIFFKTGPFSQDGVAVFWTPMTIFFAWIITFAVQTLKAITREAARPAEAGETHERSVPLATAGLS